MQFKLGLLISKCLLESTNLRLISLNLFVDSCHFSLRFADLFISLDRLVFQFSFASLFSFDFPIDDPHLGLGFLDVFLHGLKVKTDGVLLLTGFLVVCFDFVFDGSALFLKRLSLKQLFLVQFYFVCCLLNLPSQAFNLDFLLLDFGQFN